MANLHAAIGVAQIEKINTIRLSRQNACKKYYEELAGLDWIIAPKGLFETVNPFLYYVRVLNGRREELREHMKNCGVDTGIHWQAGHSFTFLKDCRRGSLIVTERIVDQILSLPLHSKMDEDDIDLVIHAIRSFNE